MSVPLCSHCHAAPRHGTSGYCATCKRIYDRDYARRKRGAKARKTAWRVLEDHEKYCPGCDRILDRGDFYKCRGKKDGLMSHCKRCDSFKQMRYQNANRKRLRPIQRERRRQFLAANPGYNARYCRRYARRRKLRKLEQIMVRVNSQE